MAYVIAHPVGTRAPRLYETKLSGGKMMGVPPDHEKWSAQPIEIRHRDLLVNLGDDPPVGSVYKCWVEPVVRRLAVRGYGEIYIYVDRLPDIVLRRLSQAFPMALKAVRRLGPDVDWEMLTEVRNPRGTKAGTYKFHPNATDVLTLLLQEGQAIRTMVKVISHEILHGVWMRYMDAQDRAEWIGVYDRFVSVREVSMKRLQEMLKDVRQIGGVRDYLKDAGPEEQAEMEIFLHWLTRVHSISVRELQDLVSSGSRIPLPDTHLHRSDIQTPVTLYSKTSAPELFCEAGSSYVVGDLSDGLLKKMLRRLR